MSTEPLYDCRKWAVWDSNSRPFWCKQNTLNQLSQPPYRHHVSIVGWLVMSQLCFHYIMAIQPLKGLEPSTFRFVGERSSIQLSYSSNLGEVGFEPTRYIYQLDLTQFPWPTRTSTPVEWNGIWTHAVTRPVRPKLTSFDQLGHSLLSEMGFEPMR